MRILVVDDEQSTTRFLKKALESSCYIVDIAKDGSQGSYFARTNDYDLVILDNILPDKTGLQVCREIRGRGKLMPILVLSIKTNVKEKVEFLNMGADDYLSKPFSFEELLARIRALLRRPMCIDGEILHCDEIMLDITKHRVFNGDEEVYLTRKEFSLLEYLMRNQGVALSRSMIFEHVWDMNADPFSNTIESHILSLRKKLKCGHTKELIQTVPGIGYRFSPRSTRSV